MLPYFYVSIIYWPKGCINNAHLPRLFQVIQLSRHLQLWCELQGVKAVILAQERHFLQKIYNEIQPLIIFIPVYSTIEKSPFQHFLRGWRIGLAKLYRKVSWGAWSLLLSRLYNFNKGTEFLLSCNLSSLDLRAVQAFIPQPSYKGRGEWMAPANHLTFNIYRYILWDTVLLGERRHPRCPLFWIFIRASKGTPELKFRLFCVQSPHLSP